MTDMLNGTSQGIDPLVSQPVVPAAQVIVEPQEKFFKQSEVTDIVKRAKHDAVESYRRLSVEQPQYLQQKYGDTQTQNQPNSQPASSSVPSHDEYRRMAAEEARRLLDERNQDAIRTSQEQDAKRTVTDFFTKLNAGKDKYQDFDKVVSDIDFGRFPNVVQLAAGYVDNTPDVMYVFGEDRAKMATLEALAERSPQDAIKMIQRLSQSIKDNQTASNTRNPNSPLKQMKPSPTGADSGVMSVSDLRKKYRG